jgi:transposase InsO family protein
MKTAFSRIGLAKLCAWFGITRQAYYQNSWSAVKQTTREDVVIDQVKQIRSNHPKMGTRKLYKKLQPFMKDHQVKMGRDALFNLLNAHHLQIRRNRRSVRTTQSFHWLRKYPNLIKGLVPTAANQLWVSDITYWRNNDSFVYISFITDVYSHKIVGYHVAPTLETVESIKALDMALSGLKIEAGTKYSLIHHSDRGIQYCSSLYVNKLKEHGIQISMTENGDPRENAVAERVNGIIKGEYLDNYRAVNLKQGKKLLASVVNLYNSDRPHMSIGNLIPNELHHATKPIKTNKLWKNYYEKNRKIVNLLQDQNQTVNTLQD